MQGDSVTRTQEATGRESVEHNEPFYSLMVFSHLYHAISEKGRIYVFMPNWFSLRKSFNKN